MHHVAGSMLCKDQILDRAARAANLANASAAAGVVENSRRALHLKEQIRAACS